MSAGIGRALGGAIYIPYALDIGGQVVTLFDPVTHIPQPPEDGGDLIRSDTAADPRWIRVRRPVITVGGELTLAQLDLSVVDHLCTEYYEGRGLELRACHLRDLVEQMVTLSSTGSSRWRSRESCSTRRAARTSSTSRCTESRRSRKG